jgi:hypothetical protein
MAVVSYFYANVLLLAGDYDAAMPYYDKALEHLAPDDNILYDYCNGLRRVHLGSKCFLQLGNVILKQMSDFADSLLEGTHLTCYVF